jgi:TubC N-terminal docking domain
MTAVELLTTAHAAGIVLRVHGDRVRVEAPAGSLTPELRHALKAGKAELLSVLTRLAGMRSTVGRVPVACAVADPVGGPGRCFSCGDPLPHAHAYGRCAPCDIACDLFYRECPDAASRWPTPDGTP